MLFELAPTPLLYTRPAAGGGIIVTGSFASIMARLTTDGVASVPLI